MGNQSCCNNTSVEPQYVDELKLTKNQSVISQRPEPLSQEIQDILSRKKPFEDKLPKRLRRVMLNGQTYQGQVDYKNRPSGYGRLYKADGSLFIGKFKRSKIQDNQQGFYIQPDGSHYFGQFVNNMANDKSGKYFSKTFQYTGGFVNSKFCGKGTQYNTNYKFEGEYENDKRKQGTLQWTENQYEFQYTGPFNSQQKFQGKGQLKESTGTYTGMFKNGKKHGQGEYNFLNRLRYVGQYFNGVKQGEGILYNSDKSISYEGSWLNGLPQGKGKTYIKKQKKASQFHEGIDVRFIDPKQLQQRRKKRKKHHNQEHSDQDHNSSIVYDS